MNTRDPRSARALAAAAALALPLLTALPAQAAPHEVFYDALGDSYAAGSGAAPGDACGRNDAAYPHVLDGRMRVALDDFAACGGARIPDLLGQLSVLDGDTDLVTVSIGGNDIRWGDAVTACLVYGEDQCAATVAAIAQGIQNQLPGALDAAYGQISAAAPGAHVVVTGYPRLFSPEYGDYAGTLPGTQIPYLASVAEQQLLNDGADLLNAVIADVAAAHGFQVVDVTHRFTGHGVNAPDAWITGIDHPVPFHPTADGQHAYGVALRSQLDPRSLR